MSNDLTFLFDGTPYHFRDWPVTAVPDVAAGVYTIWERDQFVYVGMSGRGASAEKLDERRSRGKPFGLYTRLASHASGRRSGDQFCVYVADYLVLPKLSDEQIHAISRRDLSFDSLVREHIHEQLSFRFVTTSNGDEALGIEDRIKRGALGARPTLNPA